MAQSLEAGFGVPVVEAYGMTEAAHQMASNPLPPKPRKAGSVGPAAGPDVAIMDAVGSLLPAGKIGEIVIKGSNVFFGYIGNPEANDRAFTDGWFRTGDQGHIDPDGYLLISGRIEELINRGGEKIAPREVDEVLMQHPAVAQAIAFAVPHRRLGESVAAAVVLRKGASVQGRELREFAAERLADFKVPGQILFLDELPKGPTCKLQRIGLAERLGLTGEAAAAAREDSLVEPRTPLEKAIAAIWRRVLKRDDLGIEDRFVDLGGDSLLATILVTQIEKDLGVPLSLLHMADAATIADQATIIEGLRQRLDRDVNC